MEQQLKRIKDGLRLIQKQGWQRYKGNCGVAIHRFQLNPPVTEKDLIQFETKHDVRLPVDYRAFLLEVENGGTGP